MDIVRRALASPCGQIAENAGVNGAIVVQKIRENKNANSGYNAQTSKYGDLVEDGVIDPTKVVRSALQNAASIATLLLTTDAIVSEIPEEKPKTPAPGGGMGGGMY